jgi:ceramide glucosyltransferase
LFGHGVMLILQILLGSMALFSILYAAFAALRVLAHRRGRAPGAGFCGPVTILKPLCGLDPGLQENLRSFCRQDYPSYEVIFGVRDPQDPAIPIVRQVMAEFPAVAARLVVNTRSCGPNFKVGNLASMCRVARHGVLVLADSDMRVTPDYLRTVVAPFKDPRVGATTCVYRGSPLRGIWSQLGAMGINEWFVPSVRVATTFGKLRYCFGATIAVRRPALDAFGGFQALAQELADDYLLGRRVSEQGLDIRLVPYVVENVLYEPDLRGLVLHELRWARTIRASEPLGYAFSFLTYPLPVACLAAVVLPSALGLSAVAAALTCRLLLHAAARIALGASGAFGPWLVPVREVLGFGIWCASFFGKNVRWRSDEFVLDPAGRITARPADGESARVPEYQPR